MGESNAWEVVSHPLCLVGSQVDGNWRQVLVGKWGPGSAAKLRLEFSNGGVSLWKEKERQSQLVLLCSVVLQARESCHNIDMFLISFVAYSGQLFTIIALAHCYMSSGCRIFISGGLICSWLMLMILE